MQAGAGGWWQELDLWGEDVVFHKRMLRSTYRVVDPRDADYFLVPVWVSSAMWQMNWGFRDLLDGRAHRQAARRVPAEDVAVLDATAAPTTSGSSATTRARGASA